MITMKKENELKKITLKNSRGMEINFLENGALYSMMHHNIMINQVLGSPIEQSMNNLFLRIHSKNQIKFIPMLGQQSELYCNATRLVWRGSLEALHYRCMLQLASNENLWFWIVEIENTASHQAVVDIIMTQDLGLADKNDLRLNEAYASQYIDHSILKHIKIGTIINSRQNQQQGDAYPAVMFGCINRAKGYLTDGFQLYGLDYKATNQPQALRQPQLPNKIMQYEFAMPTLQSKQVKLKSRKKTEMVFFGYYNQHQSKATSHQQLKTVDRIIKIIHRTGKQGINQSQFKQLKRSYSLFDSCDLFQSQDLTNQEIDHFFPGKKNNVEKQGTKWLSFYYANDHHVVLKQKERLTERPHGHIIRSGQDYLPNDNMLSTTAFMTGVFNAQITVGNTSFNKLLSVVRNHLNVIKTSGQRLFIKSNTGITLLAMPSAFEMGINHGRWIYKQKDMVIIVKVWTSSKHPACFLDIEIDSQTKPEIIISNNIVLGNNEWDSSGKISIDPKQQLVSCIPAKGELTRNHYPDTAFYMFPTKPQVIDVIGGDELLNNSKQNRDYPFVVFKTKPTKKITLVMTGNILNKQKGRQLVTDYIKNSDHFNTTKKAGWAYWKKFGQGAHIESTNHQLDIARLNTVMSWYFHNAMVHFTAPHGLEQYSGAAWGLRDVCQGPVELLLCTKNYGALKEVIKAIYTHQYQGSGDWPQWFMFDRYQEIQAPDSHGDIIIWPIKALCDYIEHSNDFSILENEVSFTSDKTRLFVKQKASILKHILKQINTIKSKCLPGTALISYGHGDWEDTLQPADSKMRKKMISSWTVALLYQSIRRLATIVSQTRHQAFAKELKRFSELIKTDFNKYLIKDDVVAGLVYFHSNRHVEYILHPQDKRTGIHYRLLPMTRGMISELFTYEQMEHHYQIINKNLLFPDGVRLMEKPISYLGGIEKNFKRAETAANFGREISLQYVHAHIRYCEALAKIGQAEALYQALLTINPVAIYRSVPNATRRQSNAYFSSSDAAFLDRYQAEKEFAKIKHGQIEIKGGWRIYSSGPGIYLNQLISTFLGLRELFDHVVIDPVLPQKLDQLTFDFNHDHKKVTYHYHVKMKGYGSRKITINGQLVKGFNIIENPYRDGGMLIKKQQFVRLLNREHNRIDVFV